MTEDSHKVDPGGAISEIIKVLEPLEEAGRERVLAAVNAYFGSSTSPIPQKESSTLKETPNDSVEQPISTPLKDICSFREEKQPKTAMEMAAVMAYFLQEHAPAEERKDNVDANDVEKYFKQAKYRLPGNAGATLRNAKNAGYFEAVGSGKFKLNAVGYNLVAHTLPKTSKEKKTSSRKKSSKTKNIKKKTNK